jgi:hypothetical protein
MEDWAEISVKTERHVRIVRIRPTKEQPRDGDLHVVGR